MKNLLLVFAREPKEGVVKTRLAKDIGAACAKRVYEAFLKDIVKNVSNGGYDLKILCTPESSISALKKILGEKRVYHQRGDGLSQRLTAAFEEAFRDGYEKVAAIGTDAPLIDSAAIDRCMELLDGHDCVIGPASDGGYYLIGLKKFDRDIFSGIEWSTEKVFPQTVDKLRALGFTFCEIEEMQDVDVLDDLIRFREFFDTLTEIKKKRTLNVYNLFMNKIFETGDTHEIL